MKQKGKKAYYTIARKEGDKVVIDTFKKYEHYWVKVEVIGRAGSLTEKQLPDEISDYHTYLDTDFKKKDMKYLLKD